MQGSDGKLYGNSEILASIFSFRSLLMFVRYAESNLDTFAIEMKRKLFALKDGFMISTNDMNDLMMRAILGDGNIQGAN